MAVETGRRRRSTRVADQPAKWSLASFNVLSTTVSCIACIVRLIGM